MHRIDQTTRRILPCSVWQHRAMLTALIVALVAVALYLGKQLLVSRAETAQLRSKVEHMKRRLSRTDD